MFLPHRMCSRSSATVPAILLMLVGIRWAQRNGAVPMPNHFVLVLIAVTVSALMVLAGALTVLTANLVAIPNYIQPLAAGCLLAVATGERGDKKIPRAGILVTLLLVMLVSVRAIGMTTWGVMCFARCEPCERAATG